MPSQAPPGPTAGLRIANEFIDGYGRRLGPEGVAVYAAVADWVQRGRGPPPPTLLAQQIGLSPRRVRKALTKLKQLDLLTLDPTAAPPWPLILRLLDAGAG